MAAPTEKESSSSGGENFDENEHLQPKANRYNWLTEHPKYVEMKSWKLENDEQIFITLIVYLNLCEAKDWWNVEIHPCRELQLAFITGKPKRKADKRAVLPISTETHLSPKRLKQFLQHICLPGLPSTSPSSQDEAEVTSEEDTPTSLILAITESGSTIVYYQISDGLVPPSDPPKDDADELEPSRHPVKQSRKRQKRGGPTGVQETVTEYANEERDDFMEEEL
ncbi:tRNA-splicing endonuclease subunit Sen15-like [Patiria miniata]|uniref:tRNA-splicing endonuclease subunit Sen15 domain-containing protein n=1 Tax=Patiria miniata TaxID=46514 RepID=A0A914AJT8_PATMI|nr:tRNA-splicing endonuclease subunit Sen15-like [Patiria miniata]